MVAETVYAHIVKAPGEPARLENHPRTRVAQIVMDYLEYGWSPDEIQRQHPYLTHAEVHSALAYYFDHTEEIEQEIEAEGQDVERFEESTSSPPFLSRLRALKRRHASSALS
jgi:uncharacterized protein (DUF433 family)